MSTVHTENTNLSLHDALPICGRVEWLLGLIEHEKGEPSEAIGHFSEAIRLFEQAREPENGALRSEEHTSELQSPCKLVCRLLLEIKNVIRRKHVFVKINKGRI